MNEYMLLSVFPSSRRCCRGWKHFRVSQSVMIMNVNDYVSHGLGLSVGEAGGVWRAICSKITLRLITTCHMLK